MAVKMNSLPSLMCLCMLLMCTAAHMAHAAPDLEGLDEVPAQPASSQPKPTQTPKAQPQQAASSSATATKAEPVSAKPSQPLVGKYEQYAVVFLVLYMINVLWGRSKNARYAAAWNKCFGQEGGILDKNFSTMNGTGNNLMKEAGNVYKLYASGRRHVQGLLATLNLKARQDILSMIWNIISPSEDTVTFEAFMAEASMPAIVLAVGTPRPLRKLVSDHLDLLKLTKRIQASLPGWPNEKLHIHTSHSSIFTDLFSEPRVLQTFTPTGPSAAAFKYFRSLHFTDDYSEGAHKRVLRFTFALPSPGNMDAIAPLVALVPLFIDLVGTYKLSPDLKKKFEAQRAKAAEEEEAERRNARLDAVKIRKQEKLLEEKARLARMSPAERQKAEDKLQKRMMDKQMKKRSVRV